MKRLTAITGLIALVAAILAALSVAAPTGKTGPEVRLPPKPRLPALPAEVRSRGKWLIGVKCDTPPFGWQDTSGRNRGYDVEVARQFARWALGSATRVDFTCTTTASRIPTLESKRVDIIISTLTWTAQREQQIDYSVPYYGGSQRHHGWDLEDVDEREEGRVDARLDLRPLDQELLQGHDLPDPLKPERGGPRPEEPAGRCVHVRRRLPRRRRRQ